MMTDNSKQQREFANLERAIRVVQRAQVVTRVRHVVGSTMYYTEIETKENDTVNVKEIKQIIEQVITENKQEEYLVQSKKLFLELAKSYNDNNIVIEIYDVNECGLKVHYNNVQPVQLMKV